MGLGTLVLGGAALSQLASFAVPWRYRDLFERLAPAGSRLIDPDLLHAIAWQETMLNPLLVSAPNTNGTKDYGLMQINQVNFPALGLTPETALDPERSVQAAVKHLQGLEPKALNRADLASMYNAGQAAGGGPRRRADGTYVNLSYVNAVTARYALLRVAAFAPVKRT